MNIYIHREKNKNNIIKKIDWDKIKQIIEKKSTSHDINVGVCLCVCAPNGQGQEQCFDFTI